jgi:hypothetical protein
LVNLYVEDTRILTPKSAIIYLKTEVVHSYHFQQGNPPIVPSILVKEKYPSKRDVISSHPLYLLLPAEIHQLCFAHYPFTTLATFHIANLPARIDLNSFYPNCLFLALIYTSSRARNSAWFIAYSRIWREQLVPKRPRIQSTALLYQRLLTSRLRFPKSAHPRLEVQNFLNHPRMLRHLRRPLGRTKNRR